MLNITDPRYNLLSVNHFLTRSKFRIACGLGSAGSRGRYNYNFLAAARLRASSDIAKGPPMDQIYSVLALWECFFSTLKWILLLHWNFNISVDRGFHWLTAFPFGVFPRCAHSCWRRCRTRLRSLAPSALFSLSKLIFFFFFAFPRDVRFCFSELSAAWVYLITTARRIYSTVVTFSLFWISFTACFYFLPGLMCRCTETFLPLLSGILPADIANQTSGLKVMEGGGGGGGGARGGVVGLFNRWLIFGCAQKLFRPYFWQTREELSGSIVSRIATTLWLKTLKK